MSKADLDKIDWETGNGLSDFTRWEKAKSLVEIFTKLAQEITWATKENSGYIRMPNIYKIENLTVTFLPHHASFSIGRNVIFIDSLQQIDKETIEKLLSMFQEE